MVILELVKRKCRHTMTFTIVYIMRRILSMLLFFPFILFLMWRKEQKDEKI